MKRIIIMLAMAVLCFSFTVTVGAEPNLSEMISDANEGLDDLASDVRDGVSEFFDGTGDINNGIIGDENSSPDMSVDGEVTELPELSESAEITELSTPVTESLPETDTPSTGDFGIMGFALAALASAVVACGIRKKA